MERLGVREQLPHLRPNTPTTVTHTHDEDYDPDEESPDETKQAQ